MSTRSPEPDAAVEAIPVGIIGAGQIARFHVEAIASAGGRVVTIADPHEAAGRFLAARANAVYVAEVEALLTSPDIQAVIVATPNASHFSLAMAALDAGKDVLCEKPMTTSEADSWRLVQAASARPDQIFQVGYMKRYSPGFLLLRDLLPRIGEVVCADFQVMASRQPTAIESWYRRPDQSGGGILTHSGSHLIDVMRFLLGEPVRVDARVHEAPDVPGLDLATQALIDLENGVSVHFSAISAPAAILGHSGEGWEEIVDVTGTRGRVRLSSPNWQGTAPCLLTLQMIGELETRTFRPEAGSQWAAESRAFLAAVATRRPASPGVIDGYRVDAVLAALYASGRRKAPVDVYTNLSQSSSESFAAPAKGGLALGKI